MSIEGNQYNTQRPVYDKALLDERKAVAATISPKSKADSTNPKDLLGNAKVSISKVPVIAVAHTAMAMMDGAEKYGPYNWRDKEVKASIYVDAAKRHLDCWFEGQETASDSKVHHLGHAMACCAILLDAQAKGKLVDDRPLDDADLGFMERQLELMSITIKKKRAEAADRKEKEAAASPNVCVSTAPVPARNQLGTCDRCGGLHTQDSFCVNFLPVAVRMLG